MPSTALDATPLHPQLLCVVGLFNATLVNAGASSPIRNSENCVPIAPEEDKPTEPLPSALPEASKESEICTTCIPFTKPKALLPRTVKLNSTSCVTSFNFEELEAKVLALPSVTRYKRCILL